jgi:hypothetical protein
VFVFFGFAFLFSVACSVELRSYGGLARRGTLSTFVPIQFAAPVSIFPLKKYAPARVRDSLFVD